MTTAKNHLVSILSIAIASSLACIFAFAQMSASPAITVTNMSPLEGPVSTTVTILGTGFGASQGTSTVSFHGVLATPTAWSNTTIKVPVPTGATTGPVKLCVAGKCITVGTFTVTPSITSVDPPEGPVGAEVRIIGTSFGATQGKSAVAFDGVLALPTSWSATEISVPVPAGASTGPLVVTVNGWPSNGIIFVVTN